MSKSALIALALVAGSLGSASAQTREINAWGAHFTVPSYLTDNDHDFVPSARPEVGTTGSTKFMALDAKRANNGHRTLEHAR